MSDGTPFLRVAADRIGAPGSARIAGKNAIPRHQRRKLVLNHPDRRDDGRHSKANCTSSGFESHSTGWEDCIWGIPADTICFACLDCISDWNYDLQASRAGGRIMAATDRFARNGAVHMRDRGPAPRFAAGALSALLLAGCATQQPETKVVVEEHFAIEPVGDTSVQARADFTVEDLGEALHVVEPVRVQACEGRRLKFVRVKAKGDGGTGEPQFRYRPVYEEVDPFEGLYVRRLKIRNDSAHVLSLRRIGAVLEDAAGNDNENLTRATIGRVLHRSRPCRSTHGVVDSLRGVKLIGSKIRLRHGRSAQAHVAFSGVDRTILGDWSLEVQGFPVETHETGNVSRAISFVFPLVAPRLPHHHRDAQGARVQPMESDQEDHDAHPAGLLSPATEQASRETVSGRRDKLKMSIVSSPLGMYQVLRES